MDAAAPPPPPPPAAGREYDADDHMLSLDALAKRYGTHIDVDEPVRSRGLEEGDIPRLQQQHGRNVLTPPKETPPWLVFLKGASGGRGAQAGGRVGADD